MSPEPVPARVRLRTPRVLPPSRNRRVGAGWLRARTYAQCATPVWETFRTDHAWPIIWLCNVGILIIAACMLDAKLRNICAKSWLARVCLCRGGWREGEWPWSEFVNLLNGALCITATNIQPITILVVVAPSSVQLRISCSCGGLVV
eukprot:15476535-Alexandrium_andersonii.AAC.1